MPRHQQSPNSTVKVLDTAAGKILCIADLRGRLSNVNDLVREVNAKAVIHTGDFGFFGESLLHQMFGSVCFGTCSRSLSCEQAPGPDLCTENTSVW